jgi:hypothetical protein
MSILGHDFAPLAAREARIVMEQDVGLELAKIRLRNRPALSVRSGNLSRRQGPTSYGSVFIG